MPTSRHKHAPRPSRLGGMIIASLSMAETWGLEHLQAATALAKHTADETPVNKSLQDDWEGVKSYTKDVMEKLCNHSIAPLIPSSTRNLTLQVPSNAHGLGGQQAAFLDVGANSALLTIPDVCKKVPLPTLRQGCTRGQSLHEVYIADVPLSIPAQSHNTIFAALSLAYLDNEEDFQQIAAKLADLITYDLTSTSSSWNFILADALVGGESGMSRDFATETGNPKSIAIRFLHHQWKTLHPHCKTCPPTDNKGQAARGGPQVGSLMSSMDYLPGLCFDQRPARKITPLQRVFLRSFMRSTGKMKDVDDIMSVLRLPNMTSTIVRLLGNRDPEVLAEFYGKCHAMFQQVQLNINDTMTPDDTNRSMLNITERQKYIDDLWQSICTQPVDTVMDHVFSHTPSADLARSLLQAYTSREMPRALTGWYSASLHRLQRMGDPEIGRWLLGQLAAKREWECNRVIYRMFADAFRAVLIAHRTLDDYVIFKPSHEQSVSHLVLAQVQEGTKTSGPKAIHLQSADNRRIAGGRMTVAVLERDFGISLNMTLSDFPRKL